MIPYNVLESPGVTGPDPRPTRAIEMVGRSGSSVVRRSVSVIVIPGKDGVKIRSRYLSARAGNASGTDTGVQSVKQAEWNAREVTSRGIGPMLAITARRVSLREPTWIL